jgi:predicted N-acyltransferase
MFIIYIGKFKTLFDLHQTFKTIKSNSIHQLANPILKTLVMTYCQQETEP